MSLADFDLWYNIDPETASPVTRKSVYLDTELSTNVVRWNTGTLWSGRAIDHDVEDFDVWCEENLPYKWQGLYAKAEEAKNADRFDANDISRSNWGGMLNVRKRPVVVHATQLNFPEGFIVDTLEGTMRGEPGDYLMIGVDGEKYPIAREIFEKTYEVLS